MVSYGIMNVVVSGKTSNYLPIIMSETPGLGSMVFGSLTDYSFILTKHLHPCLLIYIYRAAKKVMEELIRKSGGHSNHENC